MQEYARELELLQQTYQQTLEQVRESHVYKMYADEKIFHSKQVIGAGNYLVKHEPVFHNRPADFIRCAKIAYILHDFGRFSEIAELHRLAKDQLIEGTYDHGITGCRLLQKMPLYNDIRIWLPIRHHGHMIEKFYADPDYLSATPQMQQELRDIIFLVRDADKIANFYLVKKYSEQYKDLFFCERETTTDVISPAVVQCFEQFETTNKNLCQSKADLIINMVSWIFDLNYQSSFVFLKKTKSVESLLQRLQECNSEHDLQKKLATLTQKYIDLKNQ